MRQAILGALIGAALASAVLLAAFRAPGEDCRVITDADPVEMINRQGWTLRFFHEWRDGRSLWYLCRPR